MIKRLALLLAPDSGASGGGTAVATPPTAAPATAPTAPAAPAATDDPFADLDAHMAPPKKEPVKKEPDDKPVDPKAAKPAEKPTDKPAEKPADDKADRTFTGGPKALRDAHDKAVNESKQLRESIKTMEAKIAAAEEAGKNTEKLNKRLTDLEKERDEAKATVRLLKFEASDEFKAKYEKPFNRAAERAKSLVEGLQVTEKDAEGNDVARAATWADFTQLYSMPKAKSIALVNSMFGQAAPIVLQELLSLQKMDLDKKDALDEERTQWQTREAEEKVNEEKKIKQQAEQTETAQKLWIQVNQDIAEKNAEDFLPDPKDKQAAEVLTKALALVDSRHNSESLTLQQRVLLDAQVRLRAAGYSVVKYRNGQLRAENDELKAQIEELKGSKPGDTAHPGGGAPAPAQEEDFKTALDKLEV